MFPFKQAASSCRLAASSAGESHALNPSTARIRYFFIDVLSQVLVPCRFNEHRRWARALAPRPAILLADEPTGNLDQASGLEVIQLLEELNGQGITLILVTHDKSLGKKAERRLQMLDGTIIKDSKQKSNAHALA